MISHGEKWHYLAVKKLSALLRETTYKHHGDFYCLNCFHSFATENKLQSHNRACENKDFCNVNMPSEPFIIYADLECITEKIDGCKIKILKIHLK